MDHSEVLGMGKGRKIRIRTGKHLPLGPYLRLSLGFDNSLQEAEYENL